MSAISDDTQDGLATNRVQPKKLADLQFALDQPAILAVTDIRGTINSVNEKFCLIRQYSKVGPIGQNHPLLNSGYHSKELLRADAPCRLQWEGLARRKTTRPEGSSAYWVDRTNAPARHFLFPRYLLKLSEQFNTNRSKLTGQLKRIDGGLEWEDRRS
jgi:hypothetical protein